MTIQSRKHQSARPITVLVVEDDSAVRLAVAMGLAIRNINVLEARDGDEALRLCESLSDPIDVAVVDIVMPQMWGHELGPRLHAIRPEMPIVYTSGHSQETLISRGILAGDELFLPKPFKAGELAVLVDELLMGDRPSPLPHTESDSPPSGRW